MCGCDAWPTTIDNRSSATIQYRYLHEDYDYWSAVFELAAGKATRLPRAHYADEIVGFQIREGRRAYSLTPTGIERMHRICSRNFLDRLTTAGDCWLTYHGNGRIQFSTTPKPGIVEVDATGKRISS
jgi:hypothetical protein